MRGSTGWRTSRGAHFGPSMGQGEERVEATGGFEPPNRGFADPRLRPLGYVAWSGVGAEEETRTPTALAATAPSTLRVYQFHHLGTHSDDSKWAPRVSIAAGEPLRARGIASHGTGAQGRVQMAAGCGKQHPHQVIRLGGHPVVFSFVSSGCFCVSFVRLVSLDSSIGPGRAQAGLARCLAEPELLMCPHAWANGSTTRQSTDSIKDAPRIVSEAAVSPPPTLNSRRPRNLTAQSRGVRRQYGYTPHPERG